MPILYNLGDSKAWSGVRSSSLRSPVLSAEDKADAAKTNDAGQR